MERATQSPAQVLSIVKRAQNESGLFSSESVLNILKLIFAGAPLSEVLTIIAQLVESQGNGTLCTIWLPMRTEGNSLCGGAQSSWIQRARRANVCRSKRRILRHSCLSKGAGLCDRHPQ